MLVIGGGDGGVVREVLKHKCVEKAWHLSGACVSEEVSWCEIDGDVVDAAKRYMPSVAKAAGDPKVDLLVGDGVAFAEKSKDRNPKLLKVKGILEASVAGKQLRRCHRGLL